MTNLSTPTYNYDLAWVTTSRKKRLIGLSNSFSFSKVGGAFSQQFGSKLVKNNILDMFLTKKGERVMMPDFGSNLHRVVFEPLDLTTRMRTQEDIINLLRKYEPRVVVKKVDVGISDNPSSPRANFAIPSKVLSPYSMTPGFSNDSEIIESDRSRLTITVTLALKDDYLNDFVIDLEV